LLHRPIESAIDDGCLIGTSRNERLGIALIEAVHELMRVRHDVGFAGCGSLCAVNGITANAAANIKVSIRILFLQIG